MVLEKEKAKVKAKEKAKAKVEARKEAKILLKKGQTSEQERRCV